MSSNTILRIQKQRCILLNGKIFKHIFKGLEKKKHINTRKIQSSFQTAEIFWCQNTQNSKYPKHFPQGQAKIDTQRRHNKVCI